MCCRTGSENSASILRSTLRTQSGPARNLQVIHAFLARTAIRQRARLELHLVTVIDCAVRSQVVADRGPLHLDGSAKPPDEPRDCPVIRARMPNLEFRSMPVHYASTGRVVPRRSVPRSRSTPVHARTRPHRRSASSLDPSGVWVAELDRMTSPAWDASQSAGVGSGSWKVLD